MFVVRLIVLVFLTAYSWAMGQESSLNAFGEFISVLFIFAAPALYMLPTFEAWKNKQPNLPSIALVNLFLGWSLVGWVVAAAWAFKKQEVQTIVVAPTVPEPTKLSIACPYCAETILAAAVKCKHCGSTLPAPSRHGLTQPVEPNPESLDVDDMQRYGISLHNGQYVYESYRYDRLSDAIAYAKRQAQAK